MANRTKIVSLISAACVVLAVSIGFWPASLDAQDVEKQSRRARGESTERGASVALNVDILNREGTVTAQFWTLDSAFEADHTISSAQEMDVFAVTLHSGENDGSLPPTGSWDIGQVSGPANILHVFADKNPGVEHLRFEPPIRLKTGDTILWDPDPASPNGDLVQITLHGSAPATAAALVK